MNPIIDKAGTKRWLNEQGQPHRTDGPAIEHADGSNIWYLNGLPHRTDGPASEWADGSKSWFLNGERHRTDGPACEHIGGYYDKFWYLNGIHLTEDLFLKVTEGPVKNLPLYLGLGIDLFISERIKQHESGH